MDSRQGRHHAAVAFVGHQRHGSRLGDQKIGARNAHVGTQEVLAQRLARFAGQCRNIRLARLLVCALEQVGDFIEALVHDWRDDMRRRFIVVDLQDVLAEIGLHRLDTGGCQRLIESSLLGEHGLRLHRLLDAVPAGDVANMAADLGPVLGP